MYTFTMVVRIVKGADFYKYAFSSMLSNEKVYLFKSALFNYD